MQTLKKIQARLLDHGNYADIARKVGCTRSYIQAIAAGSKINPSYQMLKRIAEALEVKE
jgi:transcriptional regulator with XRE-family HTH domain